MKISTAFFLVLMCCMVSAISAQQMIPPSAANFPSTDHPTVPPDLKVTCLTNTNSTCPVIVWNEYVYWVYSFTDNREAMSIVAYTEDGTLVKRWDKNGARYISKISVHNENKTISLIGQADATITVGWDEIYLPIPPEAGKVPSKVHPAIPPGSKMACMPSPAVLQPSDSCYVLEWGDYTYWAFSYIDNRVSMNIVAYDPNGKLVHQWEAPGARYLYKITVDPVAQTVTFWGQADQKIMKKWSELMIK